VREYLCEICSKAFVHKTSLRHHMNVHRDTKDCCCAVCGFQCASSNLQSHLLTHNNEKKFVCGICDKSFRRKLALTEHEASHWKLKIHVCPSCHKSFSSSSGLSKHKHIHIGLRKFVCREEGCNMKFNQKVHLDKHSRRIHVSGNKTKILVINDELISH
jgi:KRAB domain-containing zinc finger protein